jgi:hypothetical protein
VSAEVIRQDAAESAGMVPGRRRRVVRPVVGVLDDGTVCYAPRGEVVTDGALVICHLCGQSFRSVAAHLASHGWTKERYCEAFGLERGQPLESAETRKLRAAALSARLIFDPAIREGSAAGRARAKSGALTADAASAARGRSFPEQRRKKAAAARKATPSPVVAQANRVRADRRLTAVAAEAATRLGYPDLQSFVAGRIEAGASLAAISREAGLHKDWLSRHLRRLDPVVAQTAAEAVAEAVAEAAAGKTELGWLPAVRSLGYADVGSYLERRHLDQHQTVSAIAAELGVSRHSLEAALRRHGLARVAHASKRHQAGQRAAAVAARLGFESIGDYVTTRRADGLTWRAMAAESGEPQTWLRRQAAGTTESVKY